MSDEKKRGHKAISIPFDVVNSLSDNRDCFMLSEKSVAMILSILDYFEWKTRWYKENGDDLNSTEIDLINSWSGNLSFEIQNAGLCSDSPFTGGLLGMFDICWYTDTDGVTSLRYTINGGCTWVTVPVCSDSHPPVSPQIPPNPSDDPADTNDLHGLLTNCQIVNGVFSYLFVTRFYLFIDEVICLALDGSGLSAAKSALVTWLSNANINTNYTYDAFWSILVNLPPHTPCIYRNCFDEEPFWDYMKCSLLPCMTGEITRSVLDCAKTALDGYEPVINTSDDITKFKLLWSQYLDAFPLAAIRSFASGLNPSTVSDVCDCDEDPIICGDYIAYDWKNSALEETFGWVSIPTGDDATQWAILPNCPFTSMVTQTMSKTSFGWMITQVGSSVTPKRAGFVQKEYELPFLLCDIYAEWVNSTGRLNTRYSVLWVREYPSGNWVPIASKFVPINSNGIPDIFWNGSIMIDAILTGATTGGGSITLQRLFINGSLS